MYKVELTKPLVIKTKILISICSPNLLVLKKIEKLVREWALWKV